MTSLPPDIDFLQDREASPDRMNRAMQFLFLLAKQGIALQPEFASAIDELRAVGLARLEQQLAPIFTDAVALDAQLQALRDQYLGAGIVPTILADAAANAAGQIASYGDAQDIAFAAYVALAQESFAALEHNHAFGDIVGLQDQLNARKPAVWRVYTAGSTWVKPENLVALRVIVIGGGGGGGSGAAEPFNGQQYYGGAGGGGGAFTSLLLRASALPANVAVTVGAGGVGGSLAAAATGDGSNGATGGTSSFGDLVRSTGGGGGQGGMAGIPAGGAGGSGMNAGAAGATANFSSVPPAPPASLGAGGGGHGSYFSTQNIFPSSSGSISPQANLPAADGAGASISDLRCAGGGGGGGARTSGVSGPPGAPGGLHGGGGGGGASGQGPGNGSSGGSGGNGVVAVLEMF